MHKASAPAFAVKTVNFYYSLWMLKSALHVLVCENEETQASRLTESLGICMEPEYLNGEIRRVIKCAAVLIHATREKYRSDAP